MVKYNPSFFYLLNTSPDFPESFYTFFDLVGRKCGKKSNETFTPSVQIILQMRKELGFLLLPYHRTYLHRYYRVTITQQRINSATSPIFFRFALQGLSGELPLD